MAEIIFLITSILETNNDLPSSIRVLSTEKTEYQFICECILHHMYYSGNANHSF